MGGGLGLQCYVGMCLAVKVKCIVKCLVPVQHLDCVLVMVSRMVLSLFDSSMKVMFTSLIII